MNTTTIPHPPVATDPVVLTPPTRRPFGVVAGVQTYKNIGYLLLGLPLGTIWFSVLISGWSVGISMLVVALAGIPMLLGMWYVGRWCANVERATANVLLGTELPPAAMAAPDRGNLWARLRATSRSRDRWREVAFLVLRFPVGIATFSAAVTAIALPFLVAYAPFAARYGDAHPFGDWRLSSRMEDIAGSPWAWLLVPLAVPLLLASLHLMNAIARACGRWATAWLGDRRSPAS